MLHAFLRNSRICIELNYTASSRAMNGASNEGERWWPAELGTPATCGSSEHFRYASFPVRRRLVIDRQGTSTIYNTGDFQFRGVLQCRVADGTMSFLSQYGRVELAQLVLVDNSHD
jgi:hypothetical protein